MRWSPAAFCIAPILLASTFDLAAQTAPGIPARSNNGVAPAETFSGSVSVAGPAAIKDLPVRKVVLYKNGVGYFEHAGTVSGNSLIKIAVSVAAGAVLVWIVNVGWVLEILAGAILLGCVVLGVFAGHLTYRNLSQSNPYWARLAVAIILGIAVCITALELTHSHRLIRDYEHYSSDYDE